MRRSPSPRRRLAVAPAALASWRSLSAGPGGRPGASAPWSRPARSPAPTPSSRGSRTARSATSRASKVTAAALPRVPQADRRAHRGEEGRPPRRQGRLRELPRRARRRRCRAAARWTARPSTTSRRPASRSTASTPRSPRTAPSATRRARSSASRPECASCHQDPHNGTLGAELHPAATAPRRRSRTTAARVRPLEDGLRAHRRRTSPSRARSATSTRSTRGSSSRAARDCHNDPHQPAFGAACAYCHTGADAGGPTRWTTRGRRIPLVGKHKAVACVSCHHQPPMRVKLAFDRCAVCHADPHKGEFKQDCVACHTRTASRARRSTTARRPGSRSPASTRRCRARRATRARPGPGGPAARRTPA